MAMMDTELAPGEAGELFDLRQARNVTGMVFRSVRRHWVRALCAFVPIFMAAVLLGSQTPKNYLSYSKLQLKPTNTSDLIAPNQIRQPDDPRAGFKETVLQQANLRSIVVDLNLVASMDANRGLVGKLLPGVADSERKILDAINELNSRITLESSKDPGIYEATIAVTWTDPVIARDIAAKLQDNFLKDRRSFEITQKERIFKLLEDRAKLRGEELAVVSKRIAGKSPLSLPVVDQAAFTSANIANDEANRALNNAQLTLDAAKADFESKYVKSTLPEVPITALDGSTKLYILGFAAGLLAALFLAAMADLLKGTFIESWQITRKLNIPILAEVGE